MGILIYYRGSRLDPAKEMETPHSCFIHMCIQSCLQPRIMNINPNISVLLGKVFPWNQLGFIFLDIFHGTLMFFTVFHKWHSSLWLYMIAIHSLFQFQMIHLFFYNLSFSEGLSSVLDQHFILYSARPLIGLDLGHIDGCRDILLKSQHNCKLKFGSKILH